jgi:hypothetical protein
VVPNQPSPRVINWLCTLALQAAKRNYCKDQGPDGKLADRPNCGSRLPPHWRRLGIRAVQLHHNRYELVEEPADRTASGYIRLFGLDHLPEMVTPPN